jgi:hypothetical protein
MRIFGLTVGRNEAHRYLVSMLQHHLAIFDDVFFYDDRSTDETADIAAELNCSGLVRPPHIPSFTENEGDFREDAWFSFETAERPHPGDWVCVVDCDEFLVSDYGADPSLVRDTLEKVITAAGMSVAVNLNIPEVWGYDEDDTPLIRVDRLWNTIHAPRLFAYRPGGQYAQGHFGVPAVPSYVMGSPWFTTDLLNLMHYGYAESSEWAGKYERYVGHTGHSNAHVESIMATDKILQRWDGPFVKQRAAWTQST